MADSANLFPQFTGHPNWYTPNGTLELEDGACVVTAVRNGADAQIVVSGRLKNQASFALLRYPLSSTTNASDLKLAKGVYRFGIDSQNFYDEFQDFTIWEERKSGNSLNLRFTPYQQGRPEGTFEIGGVESDEALSTGYVFFIFTLKPNHTYNLVTITPYLYAEPAKTDVTVEDICTDTGEFTFGRNYFQGGRIYWRVRNTDSSGLVGNWSETVSFFAHGVPKIENLTCNEKPFATLNWRANGQIAFEVQIDGDRIYGPYHDPNMTFTLPEPLEDGEHTLGLRVQNALGLYSYSDTGLWEEVTFTVENIPSTDEELKLDILADIDAAIGWTPLLYDESTEFLVYRDGELIKRLDSDAVGYLDRVVLGRHTYVVLHHLASGDYNRYDYDPVILKSDITRVSLFDGGPWIDLLLTKDQYPTNSFNQTATVEHVQIMGAKYPAAEVSEFEGLEGNYEVYWPYTEREEAYKFRALIGKAVIMKSRGEQVVIGVLEGFELPVNSQTVGYTFTITQMATDEKLTNISDSSSQLIPLRVRENRTYLPSEFGAYGFAAVEVDVKNTGDDLDVVRFGDMSPAELAAAVSNPGCTDPQWYEAIAESIRAGYSDLPISEDGTDVQPILITKHVSTYGTYRAIDDNVAGYAEVIVEVPEDEQSSSELMRSIFEGTVTVVNDVDGNIDSLPNGIFQYQPELMEVSLPSCRIIGSSAFLSCSKLTSVFAPECILIHPLAFGSCSALTSVLISNCKTIGQSAFTWCSALQTMDLPECIQIQSYAFYGCSALENVSASKCAEIGSYAFQSCRALASITMDCCTEIQYCTFSNCIGLSAVSFSQCSLVSNYAFTYCYSLSSVVLPKVKTLGVSAFQYCSALTSIEFSECTSIGSSAFYSCINLEMVSLPMCSRIESGVFFQCKKLISLYLLGSTLCPLASMTAFSSTPIGGYVSMTDGQYGSVYVPASLYDSYLSATNWSLISERLVSV